MLERKIEIPVTSDDREEEVLALLIENDIPHSIVTVSEVDAD